MEAAANGKAATTFSPKAVSEDRMPEAVTNDKVAAIFCPRWHLNTERWKAAANDKAADTFSPKAASEDRMPEAATNDKAADTFCSKATS